jgi:hypothetical protein
MPERAFFFRMSGARRVTRGWPYPPIRLVDKVCVAQAFLATVAPFLPSGKRTSEGIEVTLLVSNQELASQIGTVRELVSRNLSRLQSEEIIRLDAPMILIRDLKALEAERQASE